VELARRLELKVRRQVFTIKPAICHSKFVHERKLNDPISFAAGDLAEVLDGQSTVLIRAHPRDDRRTRASNRGAPAIPIGVIEDIEKVGSYTQVVLMRHDEGLGQAHVPVIESGTPVPVTL
jgi:hypothetical protein